MLRNLALVLLVVLIGHGFLLGQVIYTVSFPQEKLNLSSKIGGDQVTYTRISYDKLLRYTSPGAPELPRKTVKLVIPYNRSVSNLTISNLVQTTIPIANRVYPCQPQMITSVNAVPPAFVLPDNAIYQSSQTYVQQPAVKVREDYFDGFNHIVTLDLYPVQYIPSQNCLKFNTSFAVNLECNTVCNSYLLPIFRTSDVEDFCTEVVGGIIENRSQLAGFQPVKSWLYGTPEQTEIPFYTYVIITTDSFKNKFSKFTDWKMRKGLLGSSPNLIGVVSVGDIMRSPLYSAGDPLSGIFDSAGSIKNYLAQAYLRNCKFVLFVGDPSILPVRKLAIQRNVSTHENVLPSDAYFQDLNGDYKVDNDDLYGEPDDDLPDNGLELYTGRILARNSTELAGWIEKTIEYETNPFNGQYAKVARALYTQADELQLNGEADGITGMQLPEWSSFTHQIIQELPDASSTTPTGPTGANIINNLNNGYGFFSIQVHGDPYFNMVKCQGVHSLDPMYNGMRSAFYSYDSDYHVFFTNESGNGLDNLQNHLSTIAYSVACDNAHYDNELGKRCIADVFTASPNQGGPLFMGYIRKGSVTFSTDKEKEFLERIYSNTSVLNPYANVGIAFYANSTNGFILYAGDPLLSMWKTIPTKFDSVKVNRSITATTITPYTDSCNFVLQTLEGISRYYFDKGIGKKIYQNIFFPADITITKKDKIPYTFTVGGTAFNNVVVKGEHWFVTDLEIPFDKTLTILPGAKIHLKPGVKFTIKGKIYAQGTASSKIQFDRIGNSGQWGGIIIDSSAAAGSILDYVEIRNATEIQCRRGANIVIQNSKIENCTNGIYIYDAAIEIINNEIINVVNNAIYGQATATAGVTRLVGNKLKKYPGVTGYGNGLGVYLINGINVFATANDVSGFNYGMYFGGGSNSSFWNEFGSPPDRNNRIKKNGYGLTVAWGGYHEGGFVLDGALNSLDSNSYNNVLVYNSSIVYADGNYWGSSPGNNYVDGTSYFSNVIPLQTDPWFGLQKSASVDSKIVTSTFDLPKQFEHARMYERNGSKKNAASVYANLLNNEKMGVFALSAIVRLTDKESREEVERTLAGFSRRKGKLQNHARKLLADLKQTEGNTVAAITLREEIVKESDSQYEVVNALFDELFTYLYVNNDRERALLLLNEIKGIIIDDEELRNRVNYTTWKLTGELELGEVEKAHTIQSDEPVVVNSFWVSQNYPNPFNPSTTIEFNLPNDQLVNLTVYNTLGEVVCQPIKSQIMAAGKHDLVFNAGNLSAGVYLYRLSAGTENKTCKMLLLK